MEMRIKKHKKGFTLIELATVIVVLALLAVMAIPRYFEVRSKSRKSLVLGVEAALQSAVAIVKAKAKLEGDSGAGTVTLEANEGGWHSGGAPATIDTTSQLVPTGTATGIGGTSGASGGAGAIDLWGEIFVYIDVTYTTPAGFNVATFSAPGAPGTCEVVYTETTATGVVAIATDVSGC